MAVYEVIRPYEIKSEPVPVTGLTVEEVENQYAGTGLGRKTLVEICIKIELAIATCAERLSAKGYHVGGEEKLKEAAERYEISPIDILKMVLVPNYKPEG